MLSQHMSKLSYYSCQEAHMSSTAVIENGRAMLVLGGMGATNYPLSTTQIVRPGQSTEPGPDMTEWAAAHCSTTLQDGSIIVTGGGRGSDPTGSARSEVYNVTTRQWRRVKNMKQRRMHHSCTQVWLSPDSIASDILDGEVSNQSVLSIVIAGGKSKFTVLCRLSFNFNTMLTKITIHRWR
jgi:hypothetical protein